MRIAFRPIAAAFAALLLLPGVPAAAQSFPELTGRVVDEAGIIPAAEEAALAAKLKQLETASGHQLVVATVNDLEGYAVGEYGYKLGRAWKVGGEEADDGVVFLIAPNERRMHIAVGYGLEPVLTDALSGRIIRNEVTPLFKAGDYPGGIQAGVDAIAEQIQLPPEEAAARVQQAAAAEAESADESNIGGLIWVGFMVIFFFILPMLSAFGRRGKKRRRKHGPWGAAPIILWGSGIGSGSSWGGGSSFGGGGFGGFSGGGGSFGGGGASGGW